MFKPNIKTGIVLRTVNKYCNVCKKEHPHYDIQWEDGYRQISCPVFLMAFKYYKDDDDMIRRWK